MAKNNSKYFPEASAHFYKQVNDRQEYATNSLLMPRQPDLIKKIHLEAFSFHILVQYSLVTLPL